MVSSLKRILVGRPIASTEEHTQRIGKPVALAVFASDAISSTAYATEEILLVLLMAVAFPKTHSYLVPIGILAVVLLFIVLTSYRQTIYAYPNGGGAYIVSKENINANAGLVAGASLLVDYTLTVAVSISSGVLAIASAVPALRPEERRIALALAFLVLMTVGNLRGLKEAGRVFAVPTYVYVALLFSMLVIGLTRVFAFDLGPIQTSPQFAATFAHEHALASSATLFVLLRAFSSGAVVLSGVEAISNGVPAFRKPESKNAASTLTYMGLILGVGFLGIGILAHHLQPVVDERGGETVLSQMGKAVFGDTPIYYAFQIATFAILILAANTAFAGFPQLSSIIARDGYLPRQLANRGDRLAFSNGILVLSGMAALLIIGFRAEVSALIPLYAVGVFTGFTLSQFGMVRHHRREREPNWQRGAVINAVGCLATGIVLVVVVVSKFTVGAWIPAVVIPLIVLLFRGIHRHYMRVDSALLPEPGYKARRRTHTVLVLVGRVHKGVLESLAYARSMRPDRLMAVSVVSNAEEQERITKAWEDFDIPVELRTVYSPFRELQRPIVRFIDELDAEVEDDFVTVILPEFVLDHWWEQVLHNQSALLLRARLRARPNTIVTSVPFHLSGTDVQVVGSVDGLRPPPR
ncbi:MAG: APC family permease [Acidimicrobiia bacterium]|nr:APC family permease [Acidimicrobiia bacterium]